MDSFHFLLAHERDTTSLAQQLGRALARRPVVIFLRGELGAGKTTFAKGFIGALIGDRESVLSPTYSYLQTYSHQIPIYHFDLFRIEHVAEIWDLGLNDFIENPGSIRLIEWPERLEEQLLPDIDIEIIKNGLTRAAHVTCRGDVPRMFFLELAKSGNFS